MADRPLCPGKCLFRRRRRGGVRGCGLRRRLLLHDADRDDGAFVKRQQGDRERRLAEHVGRGQDCRDDEGDHDEIAALFAQHLRGDNPDPAKQGQDDRQLEGDAEGEDQGHHQRQIFADLGQELDLRGVRAARLLHAEREADQHRQHHEIDQHGAEPEENGGCDQVRQEGIALVPVEAGGNEFIDLHRHQRKRDEAGPEQRKLELGDEIFQQRGVDELRIFRPRHPDERPDQHIVDLLGNQETEDEGHAEGEQRLDQPRAQLDQVVEQRGLRGFDIGVGHDALASLRLSGAGSSATAAGWCSLMTASGSAAAWVSDSTKVCGVGASGSVGVTGGSTEGVAGGSAGLSTGSMRRDSLTSFCSDEIKLPPENPLAALRTSSKLSFRSAISASRMASWNWLWNSAAILRALPIHCPSVRRSSGSSFGPMAISATIAMRTNSLHPMSNIHTSACAKPSRARPAPTGDGTGLWSPGGPQTALLPTSDRAAGACGAVWSMLFIGSGFSATLSSSCMPFLKALMPWATSPIRSEILPRPNSSRTTAITTIQCQMLSEPILQPPKHEIACHGPSCRKRRLGGRQKQGPARRQIAVDAQLFGATVNLRDRHLLPLPVLHGERWG